MENKSLKLAIIGCGGFGNVHLDNLLKIGNVEIVALYNRSIDRLNQTGLKVPNAMLYQDVKKLIENEELDAVVIALTPDAHDEIEELCAKKGIHIFVEKPIELSYEKALKKCEEIEKANIIASVGYHERYNPVLQHIKDIIKSEPVGIVNAYWQGTMPPPKWWRTKSQSGGQILEQTTHIVDLLRNLFGEVDSVYMSGGKNPKFDLLENDVEEYSNGILNFKSGIIASLQSSCYASDEALSKIGIEIITNKTIIRYTWSKSVEIITKDKTETFYSEQDNHYPCLEAFINAVRFDDKSRVLSNYSDALKSFKVTLMANKSLETSDLIKM